MTITRNQQFDFQAILYLYSKTFELTLSLLKRHSYCHSALSFYYFYSCYHNLFNRYIIFSIIIGFMIIIILSRNWLLFKHVCVTL